MWKYNCIYQELSNDELMHYGVKGMKWGVRKDPKRVADINNMSYKKIIKLMDSGRDFYLKPDSSLYRMTLSKNEKLGGKKYVSAYEPDTHIYAYMREGTMYRDVYKTKKPLKVAGARTQVSILNEMEGKKAYDDIRMKELIDSGQITKDYLKKPISSMTNKEFSKYMYYNFSGIDRDILYKSMTEIKTYEFMKILHSKGYDAVTDMLDSSISYSVSPMVVLDTEHSIYKTESKLYH